MQYTEWEVWKGLTQELDLRAAYPGHKLSKLLPKIDQSLNGSWMGTWLPN